MNGLVRAAAVCATLALGLLSAQAADKAFKRDDLADSAIKLEAQIKAEAGPVAKSSATLRTDADAAFKRSDHRTGLQILGQIAATTPDDGANWLRLAKTVFQIRSASSSEQTFLLERASTAAYIAYQRSTTPEDESASLVTLATALTKREEWRQALNALKLALVLHETPELKAGCVERNERWVAGVAAVIQRREGDRLPARRAMLIARVARAAMEASNEHWLQTNGTTSHVEAVEQAFQALTGIVPGLAGEA